jgi:hypothetical protein
MNDLQIEVLKRGGYLPSDFSLSPDYGGPKTAQEGLDEFFKDLPANLTFGLIPKANPYGRLNPDQKRSYEAVRDADVAEALKKQQEDALKQLTTKVDATSQKQREENEKSSALELDRMIDALERIEGRRDQSRLQQIRESGRVGTQQSIEQMQALYPYLRQAGIEAREGQLSASHPGHHGVEAASATTCF